MIWLNKIIVLLWVVKARLESQAIVCKASLYDDPVCISSNDIDHEALASECCLQALSLRKIADLCPSYPNIGNSSGELLASYICPDYSRINILSRISNHKSRSLFIKCINTSDLYYLNIYSVISILAFSSIISCNTQQANLGADYDNFLKIHSSVVFFKL